MVEVINDRIWSVYDYNTVTDVEDCRYMIFLGTVIRSHFVRDVIIREVKL